MPEKTPFCCPKFSCQKKFTSDSWRLRHIKIHHPEHLQYAGQENLTICRVPRRIGSTQLHEFNANNDPGEKLDAFHYPKHVENIADSESQPPPPSLWQTNTYPGAGALLSDYIAGPWERDTQGCLKMNLQNNPNYPFGKHEEYEYIQYGIRKMGMKTYYDNMLKKGHTALRLQSFRNGDGVQNLVASMRDDQGLGECEPHTPEDIRCDDNHQRPITYCSPKIIKSMRWLMR